MGQTITPDEAVSHLREMEGMVYGICACFPTSYEVHFRLKEIAANLRHVTKTIEKEQIQNEY